MVARPTKLTPEVQEGICKDLERGHMRDCAAGVNDIDGSTFRRWMTRGAAGEEPFGAFRTAVKKAETVAEKKLIEELLDSKTKQWTARAWMLERRFGMRWRVKKEEDKPVKSEPTVILMGEDEYKARFRKDADEKAALLARIQELEGEEGDQ